MGAHGERCAGEGDLPSISGSGAHFWSWALGVDKPQNQDSGIEGAES